jgi:hypothetical protein
MEICIYNKEQQVGGILNSTMVKKKKTKTKGIKIAMK